MKETGGLRQGKEFFYLEWSKKKKHLEKNANYAKNAFRRRHSRKNEGKVNSSQRNQQVQIPGNWKKSDQGNLRTGCSQIMSSQAPG